MCGIAGICFTDRPPTKEEINKMTDAIAHRGPDGSGRHIQENVAIGHRRLSIIDLQTGDQPMCNEDRSIWITFNGEIYNFKKLREELKRLGHVFRTNSDTECVIHGYEEWKEGLLSRLRGMFAFCIVDYNAHMMFLARDHFGIKPLVYRKEKDSFTFASEINALRQVETEKPHGSTEGLIGYLRFGYVPAPLTIYENIRKLPPAHYLKYDLKKNELTEKKYWAPEFMPQKLNSRDWVEYASSVIEDSVKYHLISDVPVGIFLSGGIDSTLIALKAAKIAGNEIEAFTIGFSESAFNELTYAQEAAKKIGIKLNYDIVEKTDIEIVPHLITGHYGEPMADSSILPTWYVSKIAREKLKVVLTGDGGDELFAGYPKYLRYVNENVRNVIGRKIIMNQFSTIPRYLFGTLKKYLKNSGVVNDVGFWTDIAAKYDENIKDIMPEKYHPGINKKIPVFQNAHFYYKHCDKMSYVQAMDILSAFHGNILSKVDISTMANSLESRPPLIDIEVARVAFSLPYQMKVNKINHIPEGKYVLKKILTERFPDDFVYRKKQGFVMPKDQWLENERINRLYKNYIFDHKAGMSRFFEMDKLEKLFSRPENHADKDIIWHLFVLAAWLSKNSDIEFG
ncbi:MAG: asparagine synthase (glutamine-hydrolyzing) [Bacteroidales bacterium]|nr:asparagine synthase (glutamine-hydrolyzing) [Bacteroidales bacterium]MDD4215552.1 asparagine synthase (glutamine-hydrolyzing) [Bacteroidales bacterium]